MNERCELCGKHAPTTIELGSRLCADCQEECWVFRCDKCGTQCAQFKLLPEPNPLRCTRCVVRERLPQFDASAREAVFARLRAGEMIVAIKEARDQFNVSLRDAMVIVGEMAKEPDAIKEH